MKTSKGYNGDDADYLDKLMNDFYFNREWWCGRCRMYVAGRQEHHERLRKVIGVMEKYPQLEKLLTTEVQVYLENFAVKALKGEFEEQNDVLLFI